MYQGERDRDHRKQQTFAIYKNKNLASRERQANEVLRTFYSFPHISIQTMHYAQRLHDCNANFILRQSIQPLEHLLDIVVSENLPGVRHCHTLSHIESHLMADVQILPRSICFFARTSTESSSTIILTMTSVIISVGGMLI
jgi:adenine-specific DNA glycosylase